MIVVLGPLLASLAAIAAHRRERPVGPAALSTLVAAWALWGLAWALTPRPVAPSAGLVVLAVGLATGVGAVLAHARGPRRRAVSSPRLLPLALGVLALVGVEFVMQAHQLLFAWPAYRSLPAGAEVIEEHALEDPLLPDFSYSLSARMSAADFEAWTRALGLTACGEEHERCGTTSHATWTDGVGHFFAYDD